MTRIVNAEAAASGAPKPPEITPIDRYSLVSNDPDATRRVLDAFRTHFSADRIRETKPTSASEDFGLFGAAWQAPSVFWFVGGTDPDDVREGERGRAHRRASDEPQSARSRRFCIRRWKPALRAMVVAARAWLAA